MGIDPYYPRVAELMDVLRNIPVHPRIWHQVPAHSTEKISHFFIIAKVIVKHTCNSQLLNIFCCVNERTKEAQVDKGDNLPPGLPQVMMALTRDGQLYGELARDVEKRFGVSFDKESANRADLTGPLHGIHPLANGGGKGLKPNLREVDCKPTGSVPRVFV
ncbi:hypothetical protein CRYUN_Cryun29cG0021100 [Craigia yunnanensis]